MSVQALKLTLPTLIQAEKLLGSESKRRANALGLFDSNLFVFFYLLFSFFILERSKIL